MIENLMYIALGFVVAALIALLLAPALWQRAVRLTRREIEATMPISVADINADKDILRAEYAVEMRRLELALEKANQRAARHLMERNRHMVEMGKLESEIAGLKDSAAERTKAGSVMEQTVRKRLPELEQEIEDAKQLIVAREQELAERQVAFENQTESLELAQAMIRRQEQEIDKLRASLEGGGPILARWGKAAESDESVSQLAKDNGELQAELSRLRERIGQLEELDRKDAEALREEMHRLANLIVSGARSSGTKPAASAKKSDAAKADPAKDAPKDDEKDPGPKAETKKVKQAKPAGKGRRGLVDRLSTLKGKTEKEPA